MGARALLALGVLSLLWGSVFVLTSVGLDEMPPLLVVVYRTAFATAGLAPLALTGRRLASVITLPLAWIGAVALVQSTIPLILLTTGQQYVESSQAGVLLATQPIFSALLATQVDADERYGLAGLAAFGVGFAGVVVLLAPGVSGGPERFQGVALVLGASFCFAAGAVLLRRKLPHADPVGIATINLAASTMVLAPWALLTASHHVPSPRALAALIVLGVACTGWALALFYHLVQDVGAARAALAGYLAPGIAVVLGTVVLDEPLTFTAVAGLLLILVGSALATRPASIARSRR
jgi:drug/metabolite transporter (DMT)-like permease